MVCPAPPAAPTASSVGTSLAIICLPLPGHRPPQPAPPCMPAAPTLQESTAGAGSRYASSPDLESSASDHAGSRGALLPRPPGPLRVDMAPPRHAGSASSSDNHRPTLSPYGSSSGRSPFGSRSHVGSRGRRQASGHFAPLDMEAELPPSYSTGSLEAAGAAPSPSPSPSPDRLAASNAGGGSGMLLPPSLSVLSQPARLAAATAGASGRGWGEELGGPGSPRGRREELGGPGSPRSMHGLVRTSLVPSQVGWG